MVKKETVKTDTESRILQAAEEEFLLKGLEGARTTAIAERAGVTHAMQCVDTFDCNCLCCHGRHHFIPDFFGMGSNPFCYR